MRRRYGFALADVLLGLVLLSLIFFALASIFPISLASLRKSQHLAVATDLARETVELWSQKPFSQIAATKVPQTSTTQVDGETYTIVVSVTDQDPVVLDPNIKQIDVQVLSETGSDQAQVRDCTCVFNYINPW